MIKRLLATVLACGLVLSTTVVFAAKDEANEENKSPTVTSPKGGESWKTGTARVINWSKGSGFNFVKIQLLKSGKHALWVSKKTKNDGKHPWKIPATLATSSAYKIKITATTDNRLTDSSNKNFTITKTSGGGSSLSVTQPNGGQKWKTGKKYALKWNKGNAGAFVKIQLLKSGKHSLWISKKTKNDGRYTWTIPASVAIGSAYKVKITSRTKKTVTDTSNTNFTVTKTGGAASSLTVTTPNGGESWTTGKSYAVKWTHKTAGAYVKIQLLKSGKHHKWISKKTTNDGKHTWTIPSSVATSSAYNIKITSTSKATVKDGSNSDFTITKAVTSSPLKVTRPNGGESWKVGSSYAIQWNKNNNAGVKVDIFLYKKDSAGGGSYYKTIINATANDGAYKWAIPSSVAASSTYQVVVRSTKWGDARRDWSDNWFKIAAKEICTSFKVNCWWDGFPTNPGMKFNVSQTCSSTKREWLHLSCSTSLYYYDYSTGLYDHYYAGNNGGTAYWGGNKTLCKGDSVTFTSTKYVTNNCTITNVSDY